MSAVFAVLLTFVGPAAAARTPEPDAPTDHARRESPSQSVQESATFAPPGARPAKAVTYDEGRVPPGSRIAVRQQGGVEGTLVRLEVAGLRPGHEYGAHVHTGRCAADPAAAGGHYQHRRDPVQPSQNPEYANPHNEVWLDFTAGAHGEGAAVAHHRWGFRPGEANSVVIHSEPGNSGARLACFTVPFEPRG